MNYKLGKTPARPGAVSFKLKTYLTALPKPPTSYLESKYYPNLWGMLGNDDYGDCVWAGAGHETMFWNNEATVNVIITPANSLSDYSAVTGFNAKDPNTDQGTDMQLAAKYRQNTGIVDAQGKRHKVAAYLALDVANETELKQAISTFGVVGLGINFPNSAMTQFNAGKPWSVVKSSVEGGHYVPAVGYDSKYVYVITWGKIQKMTWGFFKKYNDESLVYLSQEMLKNGVSVGNLNVAQLETDLKAL